MYSLLHRGSKFIQYLPEDGRRKGSKHVKPLCNKLYIFSLPPLVVSDKYTHPKTVIVKNTTGMSNLMTLYYVTVVVDSVNTNTLKQKKYFLLFR